MRNQPNQQIIFLRNDEKILWEGHPSQLSLLESPYWAKTLLQWFFGALFVALGCLQLSALYIDMRTPQTAQIFMSCIAILFGVCLFCIPFFTINRLNKTRYYITNQRFVACCGTGVNMTCTYRELPDMTEMTIETISTNRYNIHIGAMNKTLRIHARDKIQNYTDNQKMLPLTFHSVVNAYNCTDVLPDYISISRRTQASPFVVR